MQITNFKKWIIPVLLVLILEIGFTFILTGNFTLVYDRKSMLLTAIILTWLILLFTPPSKNLLTIGLPLLFTISSISIKTLSQESLNVSDILCFTGFCAGVYSLLLTAGLFIIDSKIRKIYYFSALILFLFPFCALWFYYGISGSWIHPDTIMAVLQSNAAESHSYLKDNLTISSFIPLLCTLSMVTAFLCSIHTFPTLTLCSFRNKKFFFFCVAFLLVTGYLIKHGSNNSLIEIFKGTKQYVQKYNDFAQNKALRESKLKRFSLMNDSEGKGVYVLIIGESQNRLHMNAYGYERNTTPWLTAQSENTNFLFFNHAFSCHTHTVPVLTYALTAKNQYNEQKLEDAVSIIEMAKAAGYKTVWLSNQVRYGNYDTPISVIASEADQQIWINHNIGETTKTNFYDGALVEQLKALSYNDKMLIVVHLMGNHGSYSDRYPASFTQFHGQNKTIDEYDNSILYNDYVVSQLYESAQNIPNFQAMIYFSDHTDAVDQGLSHDASNFVWPMTYIPFYMAFSPTYEKAYPDTFEILQKHKTYYFTNDLIFNTLMGIMHIQANDCYEPENDLTSPAYDDNQSRFMTLYGKKKIIDSE